MSDNEKGRKQGRKEERSDKEAWLTAKEAARLLGTSSKTVRNNCIGGLFQGARKGRVNGGEGWQVPLACLPASAQVAWHDGQRKQAKAKASRVRINGGGIASTVETDGPKVSTENPYNDGLWQEFWAGVTTQTERDEATRRAEMLFEYDRMLESGLRQAEIIAALQDKFGTISRQTIWRYRKLVKGHDRSLWAPLLLPEWKGNTRRADFTEEAWGWIQGNYLIQSQPPLSMVYELALRMADERGWVIPSYDAVNDRIKSLSPGYVAMKREGKRGVDRTFAFQERDYSRLDLHEIWNTDGHKADVFVKDDDGNVFRPIVVGWQELRSRKMLGWAVGRSETSELVRRALHQSIRASGNVVPRFALMDNGMAFAAKENTGGASTRHRFKRKENEILGTMTLMGIESMWATPGAGRSKPIEPAWRHLTKMARRKEFEGAYCGNSPGNRPENFSEKNAVPLAVFMRILGETFNEYNAKAHGGNSMNKRSPNMVYEELLQFTAVKTVTDKQLRGCMLSSVPVTLDRNNGSFMIHGNRYWSQECSGLPRVTGYWARYDGDNLGAGASLYLKGVFKLDVPILEKTGFNDKNAANASRKAKRAYDKSLKELDRARERLWEAEDTGFAPAEEVADSATLGTARPKIVKPTRLPLVLPPQNSAAEEETPLIGAVEFTELLAEKLGRQGR